jgi:hypothetical protein
MFSATPKIFREKHQKKERKLRDYKIKNIFISLCGSALTQHISFFLEHTTLSRTVLFSSSSSFILISFFFGELRVVVGEH